MRLLIVYLLASTPALATDLDCEHLCHALDDVEEACESARGDGHALCESIGAVEETCDPADGGTADTCPTLCADIDALDDDCDETYGEDDPTCAGLDVLAEACEGNGDLPETTGSYDDDDDDDDDDEDEDEDDDDDDGSRSSVAPTTMGPSAGCTTLAASGTIGLGMLAILGLVTWRRRSRSE